MDPTADGFLTRLAERFLSILAATPDRAIAPREFENIEYLGQVMQARLQQADATPTRAHFRLALRSASTSAAVKAVSLPAGDAVRHQAGSVLDQAIALLAGLALPTRAGAHRLH